MALQPVSTPAWKIGKPKEITAEKLPGFVASEPPAPSSPALPPRPASKPSDATENYSFVAGAAQQSWDEYEK